MPEWTENQKKAIFNRGHDILVSAAAGSGKTTILIERIIELLKDGENVDNLLVATFTDAAAQEMKDRLTVRIKEIVADDALDNDQKQHMQAQIYKVAMANISTLHAFCLSIIKKYYYVIDLDPNFRLLSDETERSLLQEQAFDNVRNKYYQAQDLDFINLSDNFSDDKSDEGLAETVFRLYNFAVTNEDTEKWLSSLVDEYQVDGKLQDSEFFEKKLVPQLLKDIQNISEQMQSLSDVAADDTLSQNYAEVLADGIDQLSNVYTMILNKDDYDKIREQLAKFKFPRVKPLAKEIRETSDDKTILNSVVKQKTALGKQVDEKIYNGYFVQNEADALQTIQHGKQLVKKLVEVENNFIKEFQRLKTDSHVLDFNDLEHLAVKIFDTPINGKKVALEYYQSRFHEIMIDEYQDVNAMQENIIQKLSNDNNHIFMVGDIKQSIYGFRQAAPYIFTEKYQRFQRDDNPDELIQLSKNFRSSVAVDDFVNSIFSRILDTNIGDINYDKSVQLIPGTNFPQDVDSENEVYILDESASEDAEADDDSNSIEIENDQNIDKRIEKIEFAANKIKELMSKDFQVFDAKKNQYRSLRYSDIAILSRKKTGNTDLISYFAKAEIPVMVTDAQNYFQTTELQIMMSMLQIIDNPKQDVPLVAVLRSPIVNIKEESLALIRLANKNDDFYTAMHDYVAKNPDTDLANKINNFFEQLDNYRDFANKNSLVKLIWKIYQETGILEYVSGMPGGRQRAANLHALYQRANNYEQNNFMGLHKFITFIQRMQDMDRDLSQPNSIETTDDSVKVMTIHACKGLEFPVVILLNIDDAFNEKDYTADTLYDVNSGIGITVLDQVSRANVRSMQRSIISDKKQVATASEEMRLLYVALTRAKQKLILIGYTKDSAKAVENWDHIHKDEHGVIDEGVRLNAKSYQNLIGMSQLPEMTTVHDLKLGKYINQEHQMELSFVDNRSVSVNRLKTNHQTDQQIQTSEIFQNTVDQILDFKYNYQDAVNTTAYQSVSEIKGLFSDPDDAEMGRADVLTGGKYTTQQFKRPQFLADKKKVNATDIGSATHLVLQKINLSHQPAENDFTDLIEQLVNSSTLKKEVAKRIDIQSLVKFYESDLGKTIVANNQNVSREYPFSLLMPATKLFKSEKDSRSDEDKILVHGIIDGVIELDEGIIIFDYKTDNVTTKNLAEKIKDYSGQLNLYAKAISLIKQKKVIGKYLYFLKINQIEKLD